MAGVSAPAPGVSIDCVSRHKTSCPSLPDGLRGLKEIQGTYLPTGTFPLERRAFMMKSRMSRSEYPMNIFYIIGVIVVVLFVAGFFGLHA